MIKGEVGLAVESLPFLHFPEKLQLKLTSLRALIRN